MTMKKTEYSLIKKPEFIDDSMLIRFTNFPTSNTICKKYSQQDEYIRVKRNAFTTKDSSKKQFSSFKYRPSFRSLDKVKDLSGTVYTLAVERKNDDVLYERCMVKIKSILKTEPNSRRAVLRFTDSITDFANSVQSMVKLHEDISCLSHIQYMCNRATIVMRASDVYNEFIADILLINEFFLSPVYNNQPITLEFYASTTQNNECIHRTCAELCSILESNK